VRRSRRLRPRRRRWRQPFPLHGETGNTHFKLPGFWSENPGLWFAQVECILANRNVTRQFNRYCLVVEALPHESLRLVADLVEQVPGVDPYSVLKGRLLSAHQLTDFQRAEALFDMPALGGRKPSQLMAAMLEVCPRGAEKCILFPCLFLRRLPRQLRVLLARADLSDLKGLAEQADELWAHHSADDLVATLQQPLLEDEPAAAVAAVRGPPSQGGKPAHWKKKGGRRPPPKESAQSREARLAAGLCLAHWRYGDTADSCHAPCSWAGN
jgi:hypothetical protein